MILQKLVEYYDRLERDPHSDVASFGFSRQKISFEIVLKPDGALSAIGDTRVESNGRLVARLLVVPGQAKPPGPGINPCFLWDNAQYLLGFKAVDPKPDRTEKAFEAFRDRHVALEAEISDPAFSAVCRFLRDWMPEKAAAQADLAELASAFGVFRIVGAQEYVHERPAVRAYWLGQVEGADSDAPRAPSLISGHMRPVARLHEPKIKGVRGAQSSGATIVSFNADAYESYGKSQSFNAPVGVEDAFKYCTALNRLTSTRQRQVHLGDTTVVYWSERPTAFEDEFLGAFEPMDADDPTTVSRVANFFSRLRRAADGDALEEGAVPFYVLGLSPNAARVSVRFWMVGTVQQFAERLGRHLADIEIAGPLEVVQITLRRLILETAPPSNGWPDSNAVSPLLAGQLSRSILEGAKYPELLLQSILQRISAEAFANASSRTDWKSSMQRRAALLKAYLIRNWSIPMDVYLNRDHPHKAYHCGRLLAVLSFAQEQAISGISAGVVRRHMGSVMAMPGLALGRLQRAAEVGHIPKLDESIAQYTRDQLMEINVKLEDGIPLSLNAREQGVFALGFYQQLQQLTFIRDAIKEKRRHRTSLGDWVRSKLEVRVADALAKAQVPYVYEVRAVLPSGAERWPDFFVRGGGGPSTDIYIEVLGFDAPEYNARWEIKRKAYADIQITEEGGAQGRLVVLDFRKEPASDAAIIRVIAPLLPTASITYTTETESTEN